MTRGASSATAPVAGIGLRRATASDTKDRSNDSRSARTSLHLSAHRQARRTASPMPSLMKFLVVLIVVGGASFAAMYYLANYIEPKPRELTIRVPSDRFREP